MIQAADFIAHLLGTASNPLVLLTALVLPFVCSRPAAVRLGTAVAAAILGAATSGGGSAGWILALVAASSLTGLLVAEFILVLVLPAALFCLGLLQLALRRLRRSP